MSAVGTLAWIDATGGRLRRRDRAALLAQGAALQLDTIPSRVAARLGLSKPGRIDVAGLRPPDSAVASEADAMAAELPPFLAAHSHRAYLFGAALAAHDGTSHDAEVLYLAALAHDTGLARPPPDDSCFTAASADRAQVVAATAGLSSERTRVAAEAITLHFNAHVGRRHTAEARYLAAGTALDVVGLRAWRLDRETIEAVVARQPRQGFKREIVDSVERDTQRAPACRPAFLMRYGRLGRLIERAPFGE